SPREDALFGLSREPVTYETKWRAAMICAELADEDTEHRSKSNREHWAKQGIEHAERAIKLQPESIEGHYYRAINIGRVLECTFPVPSTIADLRDEAERCCRIDEHFENAGAHRLLGEFYSHAPSIPPYDFGDMEKAEKHLARALEIDPSWPENWLGY